ncbi:MAG: hypothetical protein HC910_01235 [Spirulinaceae cyanobacterium SM2_1_0]|nr:hypothetical protein [Spirulinaceae cyanobacterium SM2_1_0]
MEQVSAKISSQPTRLVCLPGGNQRLTPTARPSQSEAIQPFQPDAPDTAGAIAPQDRFQIDLHRLEAQARRINELSAELEGALWELKAIASQVNQGSYIFREQYGHDWFPAQICEYHSVELPTLRQQESSQLVLAARKVDLLYAEREASELAAKLRQRRSRKRKTTTVPALTEVNSAAPATATPEPEAQPKRRRKTATPTKTATETGDHRATKPKATSTRKRKATSTTKTTTTRRKTTKQSPEMAPTNERENR